MLKTAILKLATPIPWLPRRCLGRDYGASPTHLLFH
jgi:hypothetical protein